MFGENSLILPPLVNLSASAIASTGVYLLDDGLSLTLILGSQPSQAEMMDLFGVPSLDGYDITNLSLPALENDRSQRVRTLINELRLGRPYFCPLKIVRVTDVDFGRVTFGQHCLIAQFHTAACCQHRVGDDQRFVVNTGRSDIFYMYIKF